MSPEPDTQQRILDAARDLIFTRSYADVGVAAICDEAGVKKGSFYHFFPSKQALSLAVIDEYSADFKDNIINMAFDTGLSPMARIGRLCELLYEFQKQMFDASGHLPGCAFGNLAVELSTQNEPIRQKVASVFTRTEQVLADTLQEAIKQGEIGPINVTATAQAMLAYIEGILLLAKTRNDPAVIKELAQAITNIQIPLQKT
ncbi:TetR/AcrR family transcriptional regulator [Sulfuriflexus mobilis]|uniref:TetR/AcrR family transcriptional regulator n=1 Tax=Sulfuriflexus mobilis TaxID=1811807 RepID=UPI000F8235A5|nr:TetR/AcrR family transcriptional regulator [Sulfuriflexus mobilis]